MTRTWCYKITLVKRSKGQDIPMDFKIIVYKKFTDAVLDVTLQKAFRKNITLVELLC